MKLLFNCSKRNIYGYTNILSLSFCIFVDEESNFDHISGIQWGAESKFDRSCLGKYKTVFYIVSVFPSACILQRYNIVGFICGCEDQVSILPPLASIVVTSLASQFADYLITNGVETTTV